MVMLPFRPAPFFHNKNGAFWNLQFVGWGGVFALRAMSALANQAPWDLLLVVLVQVVTGFSISLVLSVIYRHLIQRSALVTWGATALVLAASVGLYAGIDAWLQGIYYSGTRETTFAQRIVGLAFLDGTLLGAWSALYYAINFFLQVEEQADRLERLEAQATSAQLAMLRYQLNPHFLFNTLNSISTLVLLKQTEPANAMLTRLSAFLRHTLVSEPGSKVTVAQEVETLQLYLGIERMRFEERLAHRIPRRSRSGERGAPLDAAPAAGRKRGQVCRQPAGRRRLHHAFGATRRTAAARRRVRHRAGLARNAGARQRITGVRGDWPDGVDRRRPAQHPRPPPASLRRGPPLRHPQPARGRLHGDHRDPP